MITINNELIKNFDKQKSLLSIIRDNNFFIDAPCNAVGKCGKCKIKVSGDLNEITKSEQKILSEDEIKSNIRLACLTYCNSDCEITLIENNSAVIANSVTGVNKNFSENFEFVDFELEKTSLKNQIDDEQNVIKSSKGKINSISLDILKKLPDYIRENNNNLKGIVKDKKLISLNEKAYGIALDIGTTTVVAYFYDLLNANHIGTFSGINKQKAYGADVVSRIDYANENNLDVLQTTIINQINSFIDKSKLDPKSIFEITVSGNTTMLHLLAGISPKNIGVSPFIPATMFGENFNATELGLKTNKNATIHLGKCLSAYVGGDITFGMLSVDVDNSKQTCLYIDVGTNGEMGVCKNYEITVCSTAAGPAFEGAHIKYGIGGIEGAISEVKLVDNEISFKTIANKKPLGICGSGLIDAISVLKQLEIIDETGRFADKEVLPVHLAKRIITTDQQEFIIDEKSGISITQKDVRQIQLAKAAISAGISTLLETEKISMDQIDVFYVAGGFGMFIYPESACNIGLFPEKLKNKIKIIGNAAGIGAINALLDNEFKLRAEQLAKKSKYIELSNNAFFQEEYIDNMIF